MDVPGFFVRTMSAALLVCAGHSLSLACDRATDAASEAESTLKTTAAVAADAHGPVAAINDFFAAVDERDWHRVEALLAKDFKFYSDDALVLDRGAFLLAMIEDDMVIDSLMLSQMETFVSDDSSLALVRYSLDLKSMVNGNCHDVRTVETIVLQRDPKDPARWQFVQNHASLTTK
jgi:ketosteroid isomerase-like protein